MSPFEIWYYHELSPTHWQNFSQKVFLTVRPAFVRPNQYQLEEWGWKFLTEGEVIDNTVAYFSGQGGLQKYLKLH